MAAAETMYLTKASRLEYAVKQFELITIHDRSRNKSLELRVYYPDGKGPFPIVIFSHGNTSSKDSLEAFLLSPPEDKYQLIVQDMGHNFRSSAKHFELVKPVLYHVAGQEETGYRLFTSGSCASTDSRQALS
jgi:predicted dienelactone hydrolase